MSYPKPRTISELLQFCNEQKMPLRSMRFFIGEDCPEPKAFGIFQGPDGDFVVYKNKADGSRAVRYKGPDEAFAVNEIYQKLKSETEIRKNAKGKTGYQMPVNRTAGHSGRNTTTKAKPKTGFLGFSIIEWLSILIFIVMLIICIRGNRGSNKPSRGYYRHNNVYYYYDTEDWYYYNDDWLIVDDDDFLYDDYKDYYLSYDYSDGYNINNFKNSEFYDGYYERAADNNDNDNDYYDDDDDYDWDYDYDDWDTGTTDWDTDW